ncbi:hypothetical protein [Pontibacter rugosus]|uniref:Uncharacterized protein n=1 Tax=Pontibacter rugosus TaxID=1745966 RepID=A0ABW3SKD3_9BACT
MDAYGLPNPYRFSIDKETGMIIAGDAGQVLREEMNVISKGANYGRNVKEGTTCFNAADNKNPLPDCPDRGCRGRSLVGRILPVMGMKITVLDLAIVG